MESQKHSHEIDLNNGHIIKILKPTIDWLALTITGKKAFDAQGAEQLGMSYQAYWNGFYGLVFDEIKSGSGKVTNQKGRSPHYKVNARVELAKDVYITLQTAPRSPGTAPVRLEFNPAKVSKSNLDSLQEIWSDIEFDNLEFPSLLQDARVTRLDIAIDCIGLRPVDVFVFNTKVWKTWVTTDQSFGVATAYYHASGGTKKNATVSPKSRADLMVYDKRLEQIAKQTAPIYGEKEHTRIEISLRKKCLLKALETMPFPFEGWHIRRTLVSDPPYEPWIWTLVLDSARYRGIVEANSLLPNHVKDGIKLIPEMHAPADLVTKDKTWIWWDETLVMSSVGTLVAWSGTKE